MLRSASENSETELAPIFALSFTVWGIYLLDRLYDTRSALTASGTPIRYQFAIKNRKVIIALAVLSWIGALVLLPYLPAAIFPIGGWLAVATLLYYCSFRFFPRAKSHSQLLIPSKELFIAICFAIGILVSIQSEVPTLTTWLHGFAMTCLFLGNCLTISRAESSFDSSHDETSYFSQNPNRSRLFIPALGSVALVVSLLLIGVFDSPLSGWVIFVTAAGNVLIDRSGIIPKPLIHAASDLALLIPPAVALFFHFILVR